MAVAAGRLRCRVLHLVPCHPRPSGGVISTTTKCPCECHTIPGAAAAAIEKLCPCDELIAEAEAAAEVEAAVEAVADTDGATDTDTDTVTIELIAEGKPGAPIDEYHLRRLAYPDACAPECYLYGACSVADNDVDNVTGCDRCGATDVGGRCTR